MSLKTLSTDEDDLSITYFEQIKRQNEDTTYKAVKEKAN